MNPICPNILITDFDGTMTRYDFYHLVRTQILPESVSDYWDQYFSGTLTHFEALAAYFAEIRCSEKELLRLIDRMEPDPRIPETVNQLHTNGWDTIITSAGCRWYIDHILKDIALSLEIHANPGRFTDHGLIMSYPPNGPFFSRETGIDKAAVVQKAANRGTRVAFAGDGKPDLEPALLVRPELRFAKGWLAHHLQKEDVPFVPFDTWSDIANHLVSSGL